MNENIDLTKILEGCPEGTKFYSTVFGYIEFKGISIYNTITFLHNLNVIQYSTNGKLYTYSDAECTLFPSREMRDWSKFERFWDKPKFESYIDLRDINDSMELDSGREIARLEKGKYVVTLEVRGEVRVCYKDSIYTCASDMPKELLQMFHDWKPEYEEIVDCRMNNWFEVFLWKKGKDGELYWRGISDICDAENEDEESIRKSLEEYLDENVKELR